MRGLISSLLASAALGVQAQAIDPLHSPECDAARAVLERALGDASAKRAGSAGALAKARRAAIEACLGREDAVRERSGAPDPPIAANPAANPVTIPLVIDVPRFVPASPPAPPLDVGRPAVITTCDPGGCWDSAGHRLNSIGPMLVGPRGACTVQSGVVLCP